ncbi:MAG: VWA domain-containing protein, partial [Myxococcota bacterium]
MSELGIHWASPGLFWVVGAWAFVALVVVALDRRGAGALDRLVSSALQAALVARPARWRRFSRLALLLVAGFAMAAALLQPQMGERYVATPRVGAEIMIALDVSRSMLADDAAPSRLERAKAEVRDLLAYLRDDHVGLIAFAGRASVLSPMTPDKSFLRLALDGAGPHSVPRGGTKLAEAIGRAVTGFGDPGPSQRALILITDGEDHDSFALDAAKRAAEAGIKIIAIGFGDEGGSPIYVRDPESGARVQIRDVDGRPVRSRLNGDLLRELALATEGAYVPAGTGVLDLASIYDAHIAGLTRGEIDERGRTIRDEAYQLFVAVAFVALIAGVLLIGGRPPRGGTTAVLLALLVVATAHAPEGRAETPPEDAGLEAQADVASEPAPSVAEAADVDPRERFNRANARLAAGEPTAAAAGLRDARREAPDDPALRYAATYNLGMAAVARADAEAAPEASLAALHEAADWFREAVALRPDEADPRHNLEVVLRRALILADELARQEEGDLEAALDAMIERQRGQLGRAASLLGAVAGREGLDEEAVLAQLQPAFASAATEQRVLRADADALAERVVREREAILRMAEDVRSPEDTLRAAQLEGVLVYLDASIERMGGSRRQLRLRRPERAYRRGASALGELKRSRDQLRDPVAQIDVLVAETGHLLERTGALLASDRPAATGAAAPARPAFLTRSAVEEDARRLTDRVGELAGRLGIAAEQAAQTAPAAPAQPGAPDPTALREALSAAAPLVVEAAAALDEATNQLGADEVRDAFSSESRAGRALADAQEHFFDLARLLAVAADDQTRIAELAQTDEPAIAEVRDEYAPMATELQSKNLE